MGLTYYRNNIYLLIWMERIVMDVGDKRENMRWR
jgi:hypothetical protein